MITKLTATDIAMCYQEIESTERLIIELDKAIKDHREMDFRDAFGRHRGLQLGVPSGENSHRCYDVAPPLALAVLKAHKAEKEGELMALNQQAQQEAKS